MKPRQRSRSMRKIFRRTPKGKTKIFTKRRKKEKNSCELCGMEIKRIKSDARVFGGKLCPRCVVKIISIYTRVINGEIKMEDVGVIYRNYVSALKGKK